MDNLHWCRIYALSALEVAYVLRILTTMPGFSLFLLQKAHDGVLQENVSGAVLILSTAH